MWKNKKMNNDESRFFYADCKSRTAAQFKTLQGKEHPEQREVILRILFMFLKYLKINFIVLLLLNLKIDAQNLREFPLDTLNKLDSNGKKQGYWIVYLNHNLNIEKKVKILD